MVPTPRQVFLLTLLFLLSLPAVRVLCRAVVTLKGAISIAFCFILFFSFLGSYMEIQGPCWVPNAAELFLCPPSEFPNNATETSLLIMNT